MAKFLRTICQLINGHSVHRTGKLNADKYSWLNPLCGEYYQCACGAWCFSGFSRISLGSTLELQMEALELSRSKPDRPDPKNLVPFFGVESTDG